MAPCARVSSVRLTVRTAALYSHCTLISVMKLFEGGSRWHLMPGTPRASLLLERCPSGTWRGSVGNWLAVSGTGRAHCERCGGERPALDRRSSLLAIV